MKTKFHLWMGAAAFLLIGAGVPGISLASPGFIPVTGFPNPSEIPAAALVSDGAGYFWGTSYLGGVNGFGTIFKINAATGALTTVADFTATTTGSNRGGYPEAALVSDGAGNFWGTTIAGGSGRYGTIFKVNETTGLITTMADFSDTTYGSNRGGTPYGALTSDGAGNLWGTTEVGGASNAGTVFEINEITGVLSTVTDFTNTTTGSHRGADPFGTLVGDGAGDFWGTTLYGGANSGGTIFKINQSSWALTTVADFAATTTGSNRGGNPEAALVNDGAGNFWGTTTNDGANYYGTIFEINESTGALKTVADFAATTTGSNRGGNPAAALVSDGAGNLWGTTTSGGLSGAGTVFKINEGTGALATVVDFAATTTGSNRGSYPEAAMVSDGAGEFWGTTENGGMSNTGTVFKINETTGGITTAADFAINQGDKCDAALVSDGAGNLWGTTSEGGGINSSFGTAFKVNESTWAITTVVDFAATTTGSNRGSYPQAALVGDGAGNFWGTTEYGGANGAGTVFKINASTNALTTMVDFAATTSGSNRGALPSAALVSDGVGNLWGTTQGGGLNGDGTVFNINEGTGALTTVVDFAATTTGSNRGADPWASLVSDGAGNLWGTTSSGGANGFGTIFKINQSTWALATVADFADTTTGSNRGGYPYAALVSDGAGNLWGTTWSGGANYDGTIFKINEGTGALATVADFAATATGSNRGGLPFAALASDGEGNLWGTTEIGGANSDGTVFEINDSTGNLTTVFDFTGNAGNVPGWNSDSSLLLTTAGFYGTASQGGVANGTSQTAGSGQIFLITLNPTISGESSGYIPGGGVLLSGTVDPNGADTSWYFQYGTTNSYGSQTVGEDIGNGNSGILVSATLTGLQAGTPYYYELTASNAFGMVTGSEGTFITPTAPVVKTGSASGVTGQYAMLSGTVNPAGNDCQGYFEYGLDETYGTTTTPQELGGGVDAVMVSDSATPLLSGTLYHYRMDAQDQYGTYYGPDETFETVPGPALATGSETMPASFGGLLNGTVDPAGSDTLVYFIYGTDPNFDNGGMTSSVDVGSGTNPVMVTGTLMNLNAGSLYYYEVATTGTAGSFTGPVKTFQTLSEPTLETGTASPAAGSAVVSGTINPEGENVMVYFNYEDDADYVPGQYYAYVSLGTISGTNPAVVTATLPQLDGSTEYHYRITLYDPATDFTAYGDDATFTTLNPPTFPSGGNTVVKLTATSAVLEGAANPEGEETSAYIEYHAVSSAGTKYDTAPAADLGSNTTNVLFTGTTGTLTPDTTYIFYPVTTGSAGTYQGPQTSFTTRSVNAVSQLAQVTRGAVPGAGTSGTSGVPAGAVWTGFGPPSVDDEGNLAYRGQWKSGAMSGAGVFEGQLLLAKVSGSAAGLTGMIYRTLDDPVIADGNVAYLATVAAVKGGVGKPAIFTDAVSGTLTAVMTAGMVAPGTGGATFKSFEDVGISGSSMAVLATLTPGVGLPRVTAGDASGLWMEDGAQALELALRVGTVVGTGTIAKLSAFEPGVATPGQGRGWLVTTSGGVARVMALVTFTDKTEGVVSADSLGNKVVVSRSAVAGASGSPGISGEEFASYGVPGADSAGGSAFAAMLKVGAGGVTKGNANGVFLYDIGTGKYDELAAVTGNAGPGLIFAGLKDAAVAQDGSGVTFPATIAGVGIKGASTETIWWKPAGAALSMLVQGGAAGNLAREQVPDVAGGEWAGFGSLAIATDGLGPIFEGTLLVGRGGVTQQGAKGVWGVASTGILRKFFRAGDVVGGKTVGSFTCLTAVPGSGGVPRWANDQGQVVWLAKFTDGTSGIVVTQAP